MYNPTEWNIRMRVATPRGTWFKMRHLTRKLELWMGTAHFSPGIAASAYEEQVEGHFSGLPKNAHRVIFQGDLNTGFKWVPEDREVTVVASEGKGSMVQKTLQERGLQLVPPRREQWHTPTTRPRQSGRVGQCMDLMASKYMRVHSWEILEDTFLQLGTDHELVRGIFGVNAKKQYTRHNTRPREWVGGIHQVDGLDQDVIEAMAKQYTRPKQGSRYVDPQSVKKQFRAAKLSGSPTAWKQALKARSQARKQWEHERLTRAARGDWQAFRELRPAKHEGWDVKFAERQVDDPHAAVHKHLAGVYNGEPVTAAPASADVKPFEEDELKHALAGLRKNKAVGIDHTSTELLIAVSELPGGLSHLLEWYNRILTTQVIPQQWNKPVLVLLPKLPTPQVPKDLRPIAVGSTVSKVFSRMLLARIAAKISPATSAQCAAPGRQTSDYLYTLWRVMELSREWGASFAAIKLDLAKAFDCLDRGTLLAKLRTRVTCEAEYVCWQRLLTNIEGVLQSPWGCSTLPMDKGIKQGAPESPGLFAFMAGAALDEAASEHRWAEQDRVFQGMEHEQMLYMDDGFLWTPTVAALKTRVQQLSTVLQKYGLKLNVAKCQLYCSPYCQQPHRMELAGVTLDAVEYLDVMGLKMKVGMSVYELVSPLAARAREKFWAVKHILRTKGHVKERVRVMDKIIGSSALWCISCFGPDKAAMSMLNSVQLQLLVWMLHLGKRNHEGWEEYRKRAFRSARSILHSAGCQRWSTTWVQRYWRFAGHRVRGLLHAVPVISSHYEDFRTLPWWETEQSKTHPRGLRKKQHYPRLTNLEKLMNSVCGGPWRTYTHDRTRWRELEVAWVAAADIPWSSGRQLSIREQ